MHTLKRAGYSLEEIAKLTGHKSIETLSKSYDHSIDTSDRVNMAAAIGYGPQLGRGQIKETSGKLNISY